MSKKALVFLPEGSEEMEVVIAIDVLRRAGADVTVAGLNDCAPVRCSRGVFIKPDALLSDAQGPFDLLVLPGGLACAKALSENKAVGALLKEQEAKGGLIGAICAAPTALRAHEIYAGKKITSYPSLEKQVSEGGYYCYQAQDVVEDPPLITSRGPGTSFAFALTLVRSLYGQEKASEVAKQLLLTF